MFMEKQLIKVFIYMKAKMAKEENKMTTYIN